MTLNLVEFRSIKDKEKVLIKEHDGERSSIIQAPDWCDKIIIGKGRFYFPKNQMHGSGEYEITNIIKTIFIVDKVENRQKQDTVEYISWSYVNKLKDEAKQHDKEFYTKHCDLIKDEYVQI